MREIILSAILFFGSIAHASDFSDHPRSALFEILSDSGIRGPAYQVMIESFVKLQNAHANFCEVIQYGQSVKGRPLIGIKVSNRQIQPPANAKTILIAGTIHGNEYLNIEDRLPQWFLTEGMKRTEIKKFFDQGGAILFVPIINPDGYSDRLRENTHGADLNRDFTIQRENYIRLLEPETIALTNWVKKEVQSNRRVLNISLDYHCCIGALLRPWSFSKGGNLPAAHEAKFMAIKNIFYQSFDSSYQFGRTPDILGYSALGTSKDYYYEAFGTYSFTFEGKYKTEANNFAAHTQMWERLIGFLNQNKR